MELDATATLIDLLRETFEGQVGAWTWIVDTRPGSGVFGAIEWLTHEQAFAAPAAGMKSVAAHVSHLRFALDLTCERLQGANPPADWASSFDTHEPSDEAWQHLKGELRRAYMAVLEQVRRVCAQPLHAMPAIYLIGITALIGHNAYHLGAIRQLVRLLERDDATI